MRVYLTACSFLKMVTQGLYSLQVNWAEGGQTLYMLLFFFYKDTDRKPKDNLQT